MIKEHDRIVLLKNLADEGLRKGDVGTVIHIHRRGEAFEVEFMTLAGDTVSIVTLAASDVREVTGSDLTHVREFIQA